MHVALVSTFPPTRCGIASYSAQLARACRAQGIRVTVLAELHEGTPDESDTLRCWSRSARWERDVMKTLEGVRPDVVHVQHEESILGQDGRLPALLRGLGEWGTGSVVTLHSVYGGHLGVPGFRWAPRRFQRSVGTLAGKLVVHQDFGCRDRLLSQGIEERKLALIPHGTSELDLPGRRSARASLGLPESAPVVLAIGFIHKKKGLHTLVECFPDVLHTIPNARLLVAGSFRERPWDLAYRHRLRTRMQKGLRAGWLDFREGFHGAENLNQFLAAADVIALPYRQSYGSASGVLHLALAAGKPVICANGYKFAEAKSAWGEKLSEFFPEPDRPHQWTRALIRALDDRKQLAELAEHASALGTATSWSAVAKQHRKTYEEVARDS